MSIPAFFSITGYGVANRINAVYILRRLCGYELREAKDIIDYLATGSRNYKICRIDESYIVDVNADRIREIEHPNTHARFLIEDYFRITFIDEDEETARISEQQLEEQNSIEIFTIDDIESLTPIMKKAIKKILEYDNAPEVLQTGVAFFNAIKKYLIHSNV